MSRAWRIEYEGALYHLLSRGNERGDISKTLMKKYADLPMDFADATIVCLATETRNQNIVTFDKRDFAVYRLPKKKSFTIMP